MDPSKEFEDTKGVLRIRKSKDRQHNDQLKKDNRTNNYLTNSTQKTTDRELRTPLKQGKNSVSIMSAMNATEILLS